MNLSYRSAGLEDAEAVDRVFRATFIDTFAHLYRPEDLEAFLAKFTLEAWRAELADDRFVFRLAESDGQPIGFAKMGPPELPVDTNEPWVELRQLYVMNEWRGAGAARELMDWVLAEAKARGATDLYLTVYTDNHRARRFYQKYGFVEVGPYAFMVGEQADEDLIMRKSL
ncbi:GNAT family N-acetyltransferase [Sphingomonas daechungensis]|uniref:GNAT family N-acetyltransferase n=1 Tax=Sphingomonas daechungensis TaxID=1176646 RepID=UPI0031F09CFB